MLNCYSEELKPLYSELGIEIKKLFCTMLNVRWTPEQITFLEDLFANAEPYTSSDKSWVKGLVYNEHPHLTLLYGTMDSVTENMIRTVLADWNPENIEIYDIDYFDSPDDEEYYCIIGKVDVTKNLLEAHTRISLLPHLNTYQDYTPHITLGYIKKDPILLKEIVMTTASMKPEPTEIVYDNNSGDPVVIKTF
jgi:2'-5' RNA ligase